MNFTFENVESLSADELRSLPKEQIIDCILISFFNQLISYFLYTKFIILSKNDNIFLNQLIY